MFGIEFCLVLTIAASVSAAANNQWDAVGQISVNLLKEENLEVHGARLFRHRPGLHVRHGLEVHLALQLPEYCDESFEFRLIENKNATIFTWSQRPLFQQGEAHFRLLLNQSIPVGHYTLNISDPCSKQSLGESIHLCEVNVMFNPWLDQLDHKRVRRQITIDEDEYLNNNYGYIWRAHMGFVWNYAVGSDIITSSTNRLRAMMTTEERSNTIQYSRALTRLIGNNVLRGNWGSDFSGGVEPTQWVGSEEILRRWLQSEQPVRYAQCWVYAAILTTILRASGIPARTVTNYGSHHDRGLTDDQRAVLRNYDNIVQPDESTWNFHVWSEAWFDRPDLGQPAGWNAVDATPQEPSPLDPTQPYRAGPAYVPSIRADRRTENYDTYFILAEVNAREICPVTGQPLESDIGYAVVTKKPGMASGVYNYNNAEFLNNDYKIQSVSKRASDNPDLPPPYVGCEREGGMRLNSTPVSPRIGEDFVLTVSEGTVATEDIVIRMEHRSYMGESLGFLRNFTGTREVTVMESDYVPYLSSSSVFRFSVGTYNEGGFVFHDDLIITLEYDQLQVDAMKVSEDSETITLILNYINPLSIPLTGVMVNVAGPNDTYMRMEQPDIPSNGRFTMTTSVQCGDNDDSVVMIPVSLDSEVTQSIYGSGRSSCGEESPTGGAITLSVISALPMMFISLVFVHVYI